MFTKKVLYVDDEESPRRLAVRIFAPYSTDIVDNIFTAYSLVQKDPGAYGIIFADNDQPTKGSTRTNPDSEMGLELLGLLQQLYGNLPQSGEGPKTDPDRWIVTAKPAWDLDSKVLAFGGKGVITKPIDAFKIRKITEEALRRYELK